MGLKNFKQCPSPPAVRAGWKNICLPKKLASEELKAFGFIIPHSKKVFKGDKLFQKKQTHLNTFTASGLGLFKTSVTSPEGTEQVTGFLYARGSPGSMRRLLQQPLLRCYGNRGC